MESNGKREESIDVTVIFKRHEKAFEKKRE
jgi:hypothetical protein